MRKDYKNLASEIRALNAETDLITARIDKEETEKEYKLKKVRTEYKKIHSSNLPLYKKYEAIGSTWHYKLHISSVRLTLHKMSISSNGSVEVYSLMPDSIFDDGLIDSTEKEWHNGVCKLLKIVD